MTRLRARSGATMAAIAFVVVAACGGGSTPDTEQHVHDDGSTHEHAEPSVPTSPRVNQTVVDATEDPIPDGLIDAYFACMEALGYDLSVENGVGLPDGSVFKRAGLGTPYPPPPVSLSNDQLGCQTDSGLGAALAERGFNGYPEQQQLIAARNKFVIAWVQCMTVRGWEIPPPVLDTSRGTLRVDPKPADEERAAFDLDKTECNAEAEAESSAQ